MAREGSVGIVGDTLGVPGGPRSPTWVALEGAGVSLAAAMLHTNQ